MSYLIDTYPNKFGHKSAVTTALMPVSHMSHATRHVLRLCLTPATWSIVTPVSRESRTGPHSWCHVLAVTWYVG